jgi:hypothetical protein
MPFSYDQFEDTVVSYLQTKITEDVALIFSYPENEGGWKDVIDAPLIYVAYTESDFDPTTSTDLVNQKEKPMIVCNIRALKRRGAGGANSIIALLKQHLQGLKIASTGCEPLQLQSIKLQERDPDRKEWSYNVAFSTSKNQVQVIDDSEIPVANLTEVIFNDVIQLPE